MREYSIKRGHKADINELIKKYFNIEGDVNTGIEFFVENIGKIYMKKNGSNLIVDITPPEKVVNDYSIIKKWNNFLFEATGRTAKERKKMMDKEIRK